MKLLGARVQDSDCEVLVDLLHQVGRADDLAAAAAIEHGLEMRAELISLPTEECNAILSVLEHPPAGLEELRKVLAARPHDQPP